MAVGGHGEDEQQLLEIGTVGLGVAVGDGRRAAPSNASPRGATVAAAKADRGAVVVKLIKAQAEALPDRHDHLGQQRCAVGVKESIQSAPEPVIAEVLHLVGVDAEHAAGKAVHGLLLTVDRFALDDERAQQYARARACGMAHLASEGTCLCSISSRPMRSMKWLTRGKGPKRSL